MRRLVILLMVLFATSLFASEVKWAKNFQSGIKSAKEQNKPVFFVFSRHTCKYCVMLDETTLKNDKVIKALNKDFVSIISYNDDGDYTPRELFSPGTPALWFLLPSGEPMYQPLMGAMDADNFLKALAIVKGDFEKNKSAGK